MNLFDFALLNLYRRPARTGLTVSAIAIGIAAIVALTSIAWGFEASWQKANDARGTDLIVTRIASENTMPSPFPAEKPQQIASPSTPTSLRMMSWMDLMVEEMLMNLLV
jgi:putative ABC transport system permease protein